MAGASTGLGWPGATRTAGARRRRELEAGHFTARPPAPCRPGWPGKSPRSCPARARGRSLRAVGVKGHGRVDACSSSMKLGSDGRPSRRRRREARACAMLSSFWHCCDAAHGLLSLTIASTTHLISTTVAEQDGLSLRNINWEPLKVEPRRSCLTAGATERHRGILQHKPTQSITGLHAEQQACVLGTREELAEECVVESVTRLVRRVPASVRAYDPRTQHTTYHPQRARTTLRRTRQRWAVAQAAGRRSHQAPCAAQPHRG